MKIFLLVVETRSHYKTKILSIFTILVMLLASAAQCGSQPDKNEYGHNEDDQGHNREVDFQNIAAVSLGAGEKLQVVATTNIVADLVSNVGGDLIDLTMMLPLGSDPHTFAPTPRDAAAVTEADVVFVNGLGLEEFLEELIENSGGDAAIISVSRGVKTREFGESEGYGHDEEGKEADGGVDPHVWMTPANAKVMVHNINRALSTLDPANADNYGANTEIYEAQLEELDAWVKSQIENIPAENRKMVTDHDTFGYYAGRYGLEVVGAVIPAYSTNSEPSAQELAKLQDTVSKHDVKAIFVGITVNPVLSQRLAEDSGIQLVPLYTGSLGESGSGAETYREYIRYNTTAIVEALK